MNKFSLQARQRCATFLPGAENTTNTASNRYVNAVFSRPEFNGFGRGECLSARTAAWLYPCFRPHVHPDRPKSVKDGFQSHTGAKTMPTGNTTTPKMGTLPRFTSTSTAHPERLAITPAIDLLQRADNALAMARWHLRKQSSPEVIRLATGKAMSAARALKQACAEGGAL